MENFKEWEDLTPEEINLIVTWKPPKYYIWFYKIYKKWIAKIIFLGIIISGILMAVFKDDVFNVVKYLFFFIFGLGMWALTAYLIKHFATKKFAEGLGLTLKNFNYLVRGMTWN